jgi:hypothetical protein
MRSSKTQDHDHASARIVTTPTQQVNAGHRQGRRRRRSTLTRMVGVGVATGAVLAAFTAPAALGAQTDAAQAAAGYPAGSPSYSPVAASTSPSTPIGPGASTKTGAGPAAFVNAFSGAGQTAQSGFRFDRPLVVLVLDAGGQPVPDASVTFTIHGGTGYTGTASFPSDATAVTVATGPDGHATSPEITAGTHVGQLLVTAASGAAAGANLVLTVEYAQPASIKILSGDNQHALSCTAFATPLVTQVLDGHGSPIQGPPAVVRFSIRGAATFTGGSADAEETTAANAVATSPTLQASGATPGTFTVTAVIVGETVPAAVFTETATPREPTTVTAVTGGGQTALGGNSFAQPLVVHVADQAGQPLPRAEVTFAIFGPASFSSGSTYESQTNAQGDATSRPLLAGSASGKVHISVQVGDLYTFDLYTETVIGLAPTLVVAEGGDNQTTAAGSPFPRLLVAMVLDQANNSIPAIPVAFSVVGPASFNGAPTAIVTTDPTGQAISPKLIATSRDGIVTVTATAGKVLTTFTETVRNAG